MNSDASTADAGLENQLKLQDDKLHILRSFYNGLEQLANLEIAYLLCADNRLILSVLRSSLLANFIPETSTALYRLPIVLLVNAGCILIHLFGESPAPASNATRMLSGGVLVDFVGEFPPSRTKLVFLDVVLLAIQVLLMLVGDQKRSMTKKPEADPEPDLEAQNGAEAPLDEETATDGSEALLPKNRPSDSVPIINVAAGMKELMNNDNTARATAVTANDQEARGLLAAIAARAARRR